MKIYKLMLTCGLILASIFSFAQKLKKPESNRLQQLERELYLNQIKAAEALLQLNEIAEAKATLAAANPGSRGLEWELLNSMSDRSQYTLSGHQSGVAGISISPDGKWIASGSADSTIILWDNYSLKPVATLKGHTGQVTTLDFSPDCKLLASGSTDKSIKIWDVTMRQEITTHKAEFSQGIYQLQFSPDGKNLAVCSWELVKGKPSPVQGFTKLVDATTGKMLKRFDQETHPSATLDFSPDGNKLMVATWGYIMYYYDLLTDSIEWTFDLTKNEEYSAMNSADISPDGRSVVVGTKDNRIRVIDAASGKLNYQIDPWNGHNKWVNTVSFSPDGKYFASGADDQLLMIWETATGKRINTFRGHVGQVKALAWHPDGKRIFTASLDKKIKVWQLYTAGEFFFDVCDNGPWYAPISSDGKWMAAACSDKGINIWDLEDGNKVKAFPDRNANCAAFSRDGKYLTTAGHDKVVRVWDIRNEKELFALEGHTNSVYGINFLNDQNLIVSAAADKTLRIWSAETGKEVKKIETSEASPYTMVFTPNQKNMIVGLTNGQVRVYDTNTWELKNSFQPGTGVNFMDIHPDGKKVLLGGAGGQIFLCDWNSGVIIHELKGHSSTIYALGFHPSGKYAVTGSYDRTVRMWNMETGECTLTLHGFKDEIFTVSFFDEGKKLLITETAGKVHVIDIFSKNNSKL